MNKILFCILIFVSLNISRSQVAGPATFNTNRPTVIFTPDYDSVLELNGIRYPRHPVLLGLSITNFGTNMQINFQPYTNASVLSFTLTLATNVYLTKPLNLIPGIPFTIYAKQNFPGGHTLTVDENYWLSPFGTNFVTLTNANSWSHISCVVNPDGLTISILGVSNFQ